jgi:glycopeptide antibiotics resistance protein
MEGMDPDVWGMDLAGREMTEKQHNTGVAAGKVIYPVVMVLLGVVGLVTKRHWTSEYGDLFWAYWGNVTASFSVFFIVTLMPQVRKRGRFATAAVALLVVELFELTDGFGIMSNVYDSLDLVANFVGVGLATVVDSVLTRAIARRWSNHQ